MSDNVIVIFSEFKGKLQASKLRRKKRTSKTDASVITKFGTLCLEVACRLVGVSVVSVLRNVKLP